MAHMFFNLSNIKIDDFKTILKEGYLIPSMRVLLKDIEKRFALLSQEEIKTVEELYLQTKTKKKTEELANRAGIDIEYLIVLRRLVSSYIAKPRKLEDYPDIDRPLMKRFDDLNIKTSTALYEYLESNDQLEICKSLFIDEEEYKCLVSLTNVTQLRYVSPLFATVLVRSGYDSIEKISTALSSELHQAIVATNKIQHIYKGNVGDSDAQFLIDDAKVFLKYR